MSDETFVVEFDGYWPDGNRGMVPTISGVYCVYECTFTAHDQPLLFNRLIYIGGADDINARLTNHEMHPL